MKKHTYFVENHPEITRTTHRTYTHCIMAHRNAESYKAHLLENEQSRKKHYAQTWEYWYEVSTQGTTYLQKGETMEGVKQKALDWLEKNGTTKEAYVNAAWENDLREAENVKPSCGVMTWCGRYDLALKEQSKYQKFTSYSKVEILPVHIK